MAKEEAYPPEVWIIAALKDMAELQKKANTRLEGMQSELETIRKSQEKSKVHHKYEVDLSVVRTNKEIADFTKLGLEIDSIHILPVPSAMSVRLRGLTDETVDLAVGDDYSLSGHLITRILVTNAAGSGTAYIHVYGR